MRGTGLLAVFFLLWLSCALATLIAPLSLHLGLFDALRVPVLLAAVILLPLQLLVRCWRRAAMMGLLIPFLLAPWAATGNMPTLSGMRQITLILLPSTSQQAMEYAAARSPDAIIVPDFSDGVPAFWPLATDYQLFEADGGQGVFLRRGLAAGNSLLRRNSRGLPVLLLDARIAGLDLTFAVTHLPRPFPVGQFGDQAAVVGDLRRQLADIPRPIILAGDFNALPWSAALTQLGGAIDAAPPRWTGTFPAALPLRLAIDHMRVSNELALLSLAAGPDVGSIHLPLEAVIGLPQ